MNVKDLFEKYAEGIRNFGAIDLSEKNLRGTNLSKAYLVGANLNITNLSGANLSGADLSKAQLNIARLSSANLSGAKFNHAILNVANLIRADLGEAELIEAELIRAELMRCELSGANLYKANLSGADLKEATLRHANLTKANLSEANLQKTVMTEAVLAEATLNGANATQANFSMTNLKNAELRQANLSRVDLSGADLRGANLRWADLSGANLSWADLTGAKLSGANLIGADLSHAHLRNTSLVYADLTQTCLIGADWVGADLTGAILTGAKLHAVSRFGLKTDRITCEWIDLSPHGDRSEVYRLSEQKAKNFFNETLPTVTITIDSPLDLSINLALASMYSQLAKVDSVITKPPSIEVTTRRTQLTFYVNSNSQLLPTAYFAICPFGDAIATHSNLLALGKLLQAQTVETLGKARYLRIRQLIQSLAQVINKLNSAKLELEKSLTAEVESFFKAPTQTILTNSANHKLDIYHHPTFGKHLLKQSSLSEQTQTFSKVSSPPPESMLPPVSEIIEFLQESFEELEPLTQENGK